ncbi:MAG: response regulator transcription factor [Cytophagales bacterium]|nr:response regulator transcription factor [Cytophagales bacterium]
MNIHLIEDEALLRKTLEFKFKKEGYNITTSANGFEGKESLSKNLPDLVITDIMMPLVNGLEIVSHVRNVLQSDVPIIVLSSAGLEKTVLEAFELGADDFISKPFSPNELLVRVKKMFFRRKVA